MQSSAEIASSTWRANGVGVFVGRGLLFVSKAYQASEPRTVPANFRFRLLAFLWLLITSLSESGSVQC